MHSDRDWAEEERDLDACLEEPEGWRLMALAHHSDGQWYCCLRTIDADGTGTAVAYAPTAQTAVEDAYAKAQEINEKTNAR